MPILIIIFVLFGCEKRLTEGYIVEKQYEPERTWTQIQKVGNVSVPQIYKDDEDFILIVEGFNEDNKLVRQSFYVSKEYYDEHEVGDFIYFYEDKMKYKDVKTRQE